MGEINQEQISEQPSDVDALYESIYNPKPVNEPTQTDMFEIDGQKFTKDQLLENTKNWLSNQDKLKEYEKLAEYKEVDEYVKSNPDWWNNVQSSYKNKNNVAENKNNSDNEINPNNLTPELKAIYNELTTLKHNLQITEEDKALDSEITKIKNSYKDVNFDFKDESGLTLEQQVLKHAGQIGTKSFDVAFKSFYFDKYLGKVEERGKEAVIKDLERKKKLGIISESKSSLVDKLSSSKTSKNSSYSDLANEALKELGLL